MRSLRITDSRTLWLGRVTPPFSFSAPSQVAEFALLLVLAENDVSPQEQARLSEQIVRAGCRHAVCFGKDGSRWDDSLDMVSVLDEAEGRSGPFVMTSWFDHDPLSEAVEYFRDLTAFEDWVPRHFVALIVGGDSNLEREVERVLLASFG